MTTCKHSSPDTIGLTCGFTATHTVTWHPYEAPPVSTDACPQHRDEIVAGLLLDPAYANVSVSFTVRPLAAEAAGSVGPAVAAVAAVAAFAVEG